MKCINTCNGTPYSVHIPTTAKSPCPEFPLSITFLALYGGDARQPDFGALNRLRVALSPSFFRPLRLVLTGYPNTSPFTENAYDSPFFTLYNVDETESGGKVIQTCEDLEIRQMMIIRIHNFSLRISSPLFAYLHRILPATISIPYGVLRTVSQYESGETGSCLYFTHTNYSYRIISITIPRNQRVEIT